MSYEPRQPPLFSVYTAFLVPQPWTGLHLLAIVMTWMEVGAWSLVEASPLEFKNALGWTGSTWERGVYGANSNAFDDAVGWSGLA